MAAHIYELFLETIFCFHRPIKLDEIRDQLVISVLFVPRLLKSSIQVDGCYRDSLAMATCCFHRPDVPKISNDSINRGLIDLPFEY
ncbi:hypothetical protein V1477_021038 [Vespula maculifrons]|uniref:Uncharacterized protein n=1 Tax=Vespula maculifrons TaxID=7453 RepID=A0ABD2AGZ4_VESMC